MKYQTLYSLMLIGCSNFAALAETAAGAQCYPAIQLPERLHALDKNDTEIKIQSGAVELADNKSALFSDGVELTYRDTMLSAPNARFSKTSEEMFADGGISYYNPQLKVSSKTFQAKLSNNTAILTDADYRFTRQAGRGFARELQAQDKQLRLSEASFTTCPDGDPGWSLEAENIRLNADDGWGEAWNSVVRIQDIPVLYLPYMTFPVNNQRKSGVLFPKIGSSQRVGLEIEVPYYFNLAENYDATLSTRYMSNRGLQLKNEFRYLTTADRGKVQLEYLHKEGQSLRIRQPLSWPPGTPFRLW